MGFYRKALWNTKRLNYTVLELYTVNSLIRPGRVRREVGGGSDGGGGGKCGQTNLDGSPKEGLLKRERDLEWRSKLSEKQNVSPQLFPL